MLDPAAERAVGYVLLASTVRHRLAAAADPASGLMDQERSFGSEVHHPCGVLFRQGEPSILKPRRQSPLADMNTLAGDGNVQSNR